MATTGVTCRATASGRTARSRVRLKLIVRATVVATTLARTRASTAISRVRRADAPRAGALAATAAKIADGGGRK